MTPSDRFIAETTLRVRYAETDAQGVVHHSNYIIWFETGRSHYARERGYPYAEFEKTGSMLVVTEVHARYVKPALYDQILVVRTWIEEMKSRSVVFSYEIANSETGDLLVTGTTKHICVDRSGKVVAIPVVWRSWGEHSSS
ncbi:MAG: thioesterase family protein [Anaerolineae bacterium]